MKAYFLLFNKLLLILIMVASSLYSAASPGQTREMRFERLKKEFKNPSGDFRSAPLWVWNTKVTHADIDRMLGELKEQGFGGAFIHPRPGLITEYLSDEWFELYRYSVEVSKKLGLDIWIYDENSYPSGFAGGHVPAQMPESYNQGQGLAPSKMETLPENATDYYLCLKREGDTFNDITSSLDTYKNVKGEYFLYNKTFHGKNKWHGGYSYVDLLYPGVTEKFMDVTMSGYEKEFGKELGTVIKGVFTDEPQINTPGGLRWTPDLFDVFEKKWGYDLKSVLPLLSEETGNWKQVRHNYTETLTQLFIDRWAKPWFNYCENKNLRWTGHYWEHGWPDMGHGGDNMAMYAWHQMPAIDMLFNQFNDSHPQAQFGNARSVKELRSVANQMGYTRTLSETYGGGGWDETFEDFKRLGDWEYVLGVNFMNQHLSHMTIVGARKYDYPPVFTSLSPWWENYKSQNDYFARLSLLLSQGEQMNDILVLESTTTAWLYYSYVKRHPKTMEVGQAFQSFVTKLEKSQVEYDLGSENIIKDRGSVKNGRFVIGKRAYSQVVIPPLVENIDAATFALLKKFVATGGRLITFSSPTLTNGKENPELIRFFTENSSRIIQEAEVDNRTIGELFVNNKIRFSNAVGNDLYHQRRTFKDGELVFLANSSLTETAKVNISVEGKYLMELDAMSGDIFTYPSQPNGKYIDAEVTLPPVGSILLFSSSSGIGNYGVKPEMADGRVVKPDSPLAIKRMKDNALNIDFCDLIIDGQVERNLYTVEARSKLYKHFGHNDPWNSAIQYRQTIVEQDTFKTGNIKVQYSFISIGDVDKFGAKLVAEQPDVWHVKINGKPVSAIPGHYWLDSRWGVYDISKEVTEGVNMVELSVGPMSIFAEISPVYILGDFSVESAPAGWIIRDPVTKLAPGSWKEQGHPQYSWDMSYSKNYQIEDMSARYSLKLNKWNGTVAEVFVNDEKAGLIAYKPYQFDLTPYIKKGNNKIEVRVVGSLKNIFGPHYNKEKGLNGPGHWNNVQKQLPGSDYYLFDYGLMEDFNVITK
jgi:hypothetical protein